MRKQRTARVKNIIIGALLATIMLGTASRQVKAQEADNALFGEAVIDKIAVVDSREIDIQGNAYTTYAAAYNTYAAETPQIVSFFDYQNRYNVVYSEATNAGRRVYIQRYNENMALVDSIQVEGTYPLLGNVICDDAGNYYMVWAQWDSNVEYIATICIAKYDYAGNFVAECIFYGQDTGGTSSGTRYPFRAGNCSLAINKAGILACNYAREMYNGHQSNYAVYVDISTMTRVGYLYSPYYSHAFDQRMLALDDGDFLAVNHGDAYDRGFCIHYVPMAGYAAESCIFHFREGSNRDYGYNETYAQLGGIVESENAVVFCGSSERTLSLDTAPTDKGYCGKSEARDLFVQFLKKDFYRYEGAEQYLVSGATRAATGQKPESSYTNLYLSGNEVDYGIVWLTNYTDEYYVNNPKVLVTEKNQIVLMWEKLYYATHEGMTYFAILNEDGTVAQEPMEILDVKLAGNIDPIYRDGKVYWTTREDGAEKGYVNCLDIYGSEDKIFISELKLNQTDLLMALYYDIVDLEVEVFPANATNQKLYYESSNPDVVDVRSDGHISTWGTGEAVITVRALDGSGVTASCKVKVICKVQSITLSDWNLSLNPGETKQISATVSPEEATNKEVQYSSNNEKVATVDQNGVITAKESGDAWIFVTAKDGSGMSSVCVVHVNQLVTGIWLPQNQCRIEVGNTFYMEITALPLNADNRNLTFTSSNPEVATVSEYGEVTAIAKGDAVITVSAQDAGGKSESFSVEVVNPGETQVSQGLVMENGQWVYYVDGQRDTTTTGLILHEGSWFYVKQGVMDSNAIGFVEYDGRSFYVAHGQMLTDANGLVQDPASPDDWYYVGSGQVIADHSGLAMYDDNWFLVKEGKLDTGYTGLTDYNGSRFIVASGMLKTDMPVGLQNCGDAFYYFIDGGQVADYTGLALYDEVWFYVEKGKFAADFTGVVEHSGALFHVVNGMVIEG